MADSPADSDTWARLCPPLDLDAAADLGERFLLDAIEKAAAVPDSEFVVYYSPRDSLPYFRRVAPCAAAFIAQEGDSQPERLIRCFERLQDRGRSIIVMKSDCPTLPARCIELAFDALASEQVDVVLGPLHGGGCYLIGMKVFCPQLLRDLNTDLAPIREQVIQRAAELHLGWYLLPEWYDVHQPSDLAHLVSELLDHWVIHPYADHTRSYLMGLIERGLV